ncbi:MAG: acetolactate synthase large subunit [Syntrophales bacterium]
MNGAEAIIRAAKEAGIEACFANPGTTELPLVVALDTVGGIRPILGLTEAVCTGAADGYARMSGKPAMALLHLGPGFANGISNLHNARRGSIPVVTVVGEHATWHRALDPPLAMDIEALARTVSGWQRTCGSSDLLGQETAEAVLAARRGQVATLIVPYDLQLNPCRPGVIAPHPERREPASRASIDLAAALLKGGGKTALVLGGEGLGRAGLLTAARIRRACGCDLLAEGRPARAERGAGLPDARRIPYLPEEAIEMLAPYEAFVFAGAEEPVSFFGYAGVPGKLIPEDRKRIPLAGREDDVAEALGLLADALGAPRNPAADGLCRPKRPALPTGALNGDKMCAVVAALQPEGAIVVEEAVTNGRKYYALTAGVPPCSLLTLTGGSLGQGPPCAAGAAVACPERPVINIQADGAGMYTFPALWTEAKEGLNVTTLICANRGYNILKLELGRLGVSAPGANARRLTDLGGIDWVGLGRGMGVSSVRAATAEELASELGKALGEPGPHLIEMVI